MAATKYLHVTGSSPALAMSGLNAPGVRDGVRILATTMAYNATGWSTGDTLCIKLEQAQKVHFLSMVKAGAPETQIACAVAAFTKGAYDYCDGISITSDSAITTSSAADDIVILVVYSIEKEVVNRLAISAT